MSAPHHPSRSLRFGAALFLGWATSGFAAETDIEARFAALESRLAAVERENARLRSQLEVRSVRPPAPPLAPAADAPPSAAAAELPAPAPKSILRSLKFAGYAQIHAELGGEPDRRFTDVDNRIFIRRVDIGVSGELSHGFAFKTEAELSSGSLGEKSGHTPRLTDAYVTWAATDQFGLKIGQFKSPFGRAQLMSNTKLPLVERPLSSDSLTVSRQVGIAAEGSADPGIPLTYSLGFFNGTGANNSFTTNSEFMTVGRVAAQVWSNDKSVWDIATNAYHYDPATAGRDRRIGWGIDTRFKFGRSETEAEYLQLTTDRTGLPTATAEGWWITSLWNLAPQWQAVLRFDSYDPNTDLAGDDTTAWTFGGNYLVRGDDIKFSLNYLWGDSPAAHEGRLLGRLQVKF